MHTFHKMHNYIFILVLGFRLTGETKCIFMWTKSVIVSCECLPRIDLSSWPITTPTNRLPGHTTHRDVIDVLILILYFDHLISDVYRWPV